MLAQRTFVLIFRVANIVPDILTAVVRVDIALKVWCLLAELMEGSLVVDNAEIDLIVGIGVKYLNAVVESAAIVSGVGDLLLIETSVSNLSVTKLHDDLCVCVCK